MKTFTDNGLTYHGVYVTTPLGEEIASLGCELTDAIIAKLETEHGNLVFTFQGGDLDGVEA
jgi:hypothetical protein